MQNNTPHTTTEPAAARIPQIIYPNSVPRSPAYKMMLQRLCLEVAMEDTVQIKIRYKDEMIGLLCVLSIEPGMFNNIAE